jgi:hypothetical protein
MDGGTVARQVTTRDIERMGQLVTIDHFEKLGSDTEGYGTYDEKMTQYKNVRMIVSEPPNLKRMVEEEGITESRYHIGQVKYDQEIWVRDIVTVASGQKFVVVHVWEQRPAGVVICKFARMQRYTFPQGAGLS